MKLFNTNNNGTQIKTRAANSENSWNKRAGTNRRSNKECFCNAFIQMLGYDIFNPTEVIPEYIADIGTKKGEKVDYLIKNNQEPILIIECKTGRKMPMLIIRSFTDIIMFLKPGLVY